MIHSSRPFTADKITGVHHRDLSFVMPWYYIGGSAEHCTECGGHLERVKAQVANELTTHRTKMIKREMWRCRRCGQMFGIDEPKESTDG